MSPVIIGSNPVGPRAELVLKIGLVWAGCPQTKPNPIGQGFGPEGTRSKHMTKKGIHNLDLTYEDSQKVTWIELITTIIEE